MFWKKAVLLNFAKLTGKNMWWSLYLKRVSGYRPAVLLKREFDTIIFL